VKVQAKTEEPHVIPPVLSVGAMVLGVLLVGAGATSFLILCVDLLDESIKT